MRWFLNLPKELVIELLSWLMPSDLMTLDQVDIDQDNISQDLAMYREILSSHLFIYEASIAHGILVPPQFYHWVELRKVRVRQLLLTHQHLGRTVANWNRKIHKSFLHNLTLRSTILSNAIHVSMVLRVLSSCNELRQLALYNIHKVTPKHYLNFDPACDSLQNLQFVDCTLECVQLVSQACQNITHLYVQNNPDNYDTYSANQFRVSSSYLMQILETNHCLSTIEIPWADEEIADNVFWFINKFVQNTMTYDVVFKRIVLPTASLMELKVLEFTGDINIIRIDHATIEEISFPRYISPTSLNRIPIYYGNIRSVTLSLSRKMEVEYICQFGKAVSGTLKALSLNDCGEYSNAEICSMFAQPSTPFSALTALTIDGCQQLELSTYHKLRTSLHSLLTLDLLRCHKLAARVILPKDVKVTITA